MLALDDQALARLFIAASGVPQPERARWLQRFARRLDPTPNALYSRRWRTRERSGLSLYHIELDTIAIETLLQREGLLPSYTELERADVERALTTFILKLIELSAQDIAPGRSTPR
jgi:hypothetical protein